MSSEKLPRKSEYEKRQPWEQLQDETNKAYQYFSQFRDMGLDRSIRALAEKLGKNSRTLYELNQKHEWAKRVAAWDLDLDRKKTAGTRRKAIEAKEFHNEVAERMIKLGKARLELIKNVTPEDLTVTEASRLIKDGAEMQREALGISSGSEGGGVVLPVSVSVEIVHTYPPNG